jgi:hypothetical protein
MCFAGWGADELFAYSFISVSSNFVSEKFKNATLKAWLFFLAGAFAMGLSIWEFLVETGNRRMTRERRAQILGQGIGASL